MTSDYGTMLLNAKEERDRDSADVSFVLSFGCRIFLDGDQWCCLFGENLQVGHGTFGKSPMGAVEKMRAFLYTGKQNE